MRQGAAILCAVRNVTSHVRFCNLGDMSKLVKWRPPRAARRGSVHGGRRWHQWVGEGFPKPIAAPQRAGARQ